MAWDTDTPSFYRSVFEAVEEMASCNQTALDLVENTFLTGACIRTLTEEIMETYSADVYNIENQYMRPEALGKKWEVIEKYIPDLDFSYGSFLYEQAKGHL